RPPLPPPPHVALQWGLHPGPAYPGPYAPHGHPPPPPPPPSRFSKARSTPHHAPYTHSGPGGFREPVGEFPLPSSSSSHANAADPGRHRASADPSCGGSGQWDSHPPPPPRLHHHPPSSYHMGAGSSSGLGRSGFHHPHHHHPNKHHHHHHHF
ncbi:formin-like protein 20, partial [Aplysia californica]|uniref:Formin-like protein 20 n=1 Tax=Aplysia californica TaxID=6500 RepID=A0ABM1ADH0_APLCA